MARPGPAPPLDLESLRDAEGLAVAVQRPRAPGVAQALELLILDLGELVRLADCHRLEVSVGEARSLGGVHTTQTCSGLQKRML